MSQIARAADSVSRRSFFKIVIAGAGAACLAGGSAKAWAAETPLPKPVKIAIMSDLHYFSTSLWSDCPDYTTAENSDRKMFKESGAILDAALASIVAARPDIVIVPGDLTKDSEVVCHEEAHAKIAAAREQLKAAGVDTKFFVINGNHDVNNTNGAACRPCDVQADLGGLRLRRGQHPVCARKLRRRQPVLYRTPRRRHHADRR